MKDYRIIDKEEAIPLALAGKTVKAIDFEGEILYEVNDMQVFELRRLMQEKNVIFVVRRGYE